MVPHHSVDPVLATRQHCECLAVEFVPLRAPVAPPSRPAVVASILVSHASRVRGGVRGGITRWVWLAVRRKVLLVQVVQGDRLVARHHTHRPMLLIGRPRRHHWVRGIPNTNSSVYSVLDLRWRVPKEMCCVNIPAVLLQVQSPLVPHPLVSHPL